MARQWAWMAHGAHNAAVHVDLDVDEERATLRDCVEAIEAATGRRPLGWLGPALPRRSTRQRCSRASASPTRAIGATTTAPTQ